MSVIVCDIVDVWSSCQKIIQKVHKNKPCNVTFALEEEFDVLVVGDDAIVDDDKLVGVV